MAQETAASMAAPEGGLLRAWTDALLHPKFETYARWFPLMQARWRRISLAVSLPLLLGAIFVVIAHDAMYEGNVIQTLTLSHFLNYFASPHGLFELFALFTGAVAAIFAMPATAALFAHRSIGRYRIRCYIAYCTWMQTLPITSVFLILGAAGYFVFGAFNFDSTSFIGQAAGVILVYFPAAMAFALAFTGLSAATRRGVYILLLPAVALYMLIDMLVWHLLGHILISFGYPVL